MQKYNGNNTHNNAIDVDFTRKNVVFKPIISNGTFETTTFSDGVNNIIFLLTVYYILMLVFESAVVGTDVKTHFIVTFVVFWTIRPLVYLFDKYVLRKISAWPNVAPKVFAIIVGITKVLKWKRPFTKVTIKPHMVEDNKIIIPEFDNVYLDYVFKDDFAKQIESIKIKPHCLWNPFKWSATFTFKEKVVNGEMSLIYI